MNKIDIDFIKNMYDVHHMVAEHDHLNGGKKSLEIFVNALTNDVSYIVFCNLYKPIFENQCRIYTNYIKAVLEYNRINLSKDV